MPDDGACTPLQLVEATDDTEQASGRLLECRGGPFDAEHRFFSTSHGTVVLSLIHDDDHPQYRRWSGPQVYLLSADAAVYVGPSPNPTTEDEDDDFA